jgi:hypothetical protein
MHSTGAHKRKAQVKPEEVEKRVKKDDLRSDIATCNCRNCVRSCQQSTHSTAGRFHLYYKLCTGEVKACMADAPANNWKPEMQTLMFEYSRKCLCGGPGTRREVSQ